MPIGITLHGKMMKRLRDPASLARFCCRSFNPPVPKTISRTRISSCQLFSSIPLFHYFFVFQKSSSSQPIQICSAEWEMRRIKRTRFTLSLGCDVLNAGAGLCQSALAWPYTHTHALVIWCDRVAQKTQLQIKTKSWGHYVDQTVGRVDAMKVHDERGKSTEKVFDSVLLESEPPSVSLSTTMGLWSDQHSHLIFSEGRILFSYLARVLILAGHRTGSFIFFSVAICRWFTFTCLRLSGLIKKNDLKSRSKSLL